MTRGPNYEIYEEFYKSIFCPKSIAIILAQIILDWLGQIHANLAFVDNIYHPNLGFTVLQLNKVDLK